MRPNHFGAAVRLAFLLAFALALVGVGCGDDQPKRQRPAGGNTNELCVRDPALIAEARACVADDHCPCGSHCELGECVATCLKDTECGAGATCDAFGRCRAAGDTGLLPPPAPTAEGDLTVFPASLRAIDPTQPRPLRLVAGDRAVGTIRIAAGQGIEVDCGGGFAASCRIDGLAAAEHRIVQVRAAGLEGAGELTVFWGDRRSSVGFVVGTAGAGFVANEARPFSGTYTGVLRTLEVGYSTDAEGAGTEANLDLPIEAEIYDGGATGRSVLVLHDPQKALAPDGLWIGEIRHLDGTLHLPRVRLFAGAAAAGAEVELFAEAPPAPVAITGGERTLSVSVALAIRTVSTVGAPAAPQTRYQLSLTRSGDLAEGALAPPVPADAQPAATPPSPTVPTAWEAATLRAFAPLDASEMVEVLEGFSGTRTTLAACSFLPEDRDAVVWKMFYDAWLKGTFAWEDGIRFSAPASVIRADTRPLVQALLAPRAANAASWMNWDPGVQVGFTIESFPTDFSAASGEGIDGAVACALEFDPFDIDAAQTGGDEYCGEINWQNTNVHYAPGTLDRCDAMAAQWGCDVEEVVAPTGGSTPTVRFGMNGDISYSYCCSDTCRYDFSGNDRQIDARVKKVCRLRAPASCPEGVMCETADASPNSVRAGTTPVAPHRDFACTSGGRDLGVEFDTNAAELDAAEMIDACVADLERVLEAPAGGQTLAQAFASSGCVSVPRLLLALGASSELGRMPDGHFSDARAAAVAHRLLQRWVGLHGDLAAHVVQAGRLSEVVRKLDSADATLPPGMDAALALSLRGWDLLLHPRFAAVIEAMPDAILYEPDYRPLITGAAFPAPPSDQQPEGLAVVLTAALRAEAELAEMRLEQALFHGDRTALDAAAQILRYASMARPLAAHLAARARAWGELQGTGAPAWFSRYDRNAQMVEARLKRIVVLAKALREGANPLGIEETDLPLYFFGDEAGAGRRFSAVSDYLLRDVAGGLSAPALVRDAQSALADARASWLAFQDRDLQRQRDQSSIDAQLDSIRSEYGERISALCGAPADALPRQLLEGWSSLQGRPFTGEDCFFRHDDPACEATLHGYGSMLSLDDVQYQFCVARELQVRTGQKPRFPNARFGDVVHAWDECSDPANVEFPVACGDSESCYRCAATGQLLDMDEAREQFGRMGYEGVTARVMTEVKSSCAASWPRAFEELPTLELATDAIDRGACYRGSIGELALTLRGVAKEVEIARSEMAELTDSYDIAMQSCMIAKLGNDEIASATEKHNATMSKLRAGKLAADIAANAAGAVKDCASAVGADNKFGAASGAACGAAAVEAAAESVSDGLQFAMDEAEQAHEALVASIEARVENERCLKDAELYLVGTKTAALRIERAVQELDVAAYQLAGLKGDAEDAYAAGLDALARTSGRSVVTPAEDYWLDDKVRLFTSRMRLARRVVYLAVRAVEYEYQQSLQLRQATLSAATPDELEEVVRQLQASAGTRRINGNLPGEQKAVVSLRSQLLQLADHGDLSENELRLSEADRFRLLLQDPRFAFYDENGAWAGQRIPFRVAPLAAMGLGDAAGVRIFSQGDCAERLWSVNASVQGGEGLYVGQAVSARIELQQANTFFSQWCSAGANEAFQTASIRPSRNLFLDDVVGGNLGAGLVTGETEAYARSRIEAFFNVSREAFTADDYANGDSLELAARGLYGDYALVIPAGEISVAGADGRRSPGLDLDRIDDILLRFDYVSVAR